MRVNFNYKALHDWILQKQLLGDGAGIHKLICRLCSVKDAMEMYTRAVNEGKFSEAQQYKDFGLEMLALVGEDTAFWDMYVTEIIT